jgi:hypothetical protein
VLVLALVAAPSSATPPSSVCHSIRVGETATQLARRITGDGRNKYQPWFQIMDASSRFVPKSQYNRIRPGWRGCIVNEVIESLVPPAEAEERATDIPDVPSVPAVSSVSSGPAVSDVSAGPAVPATPADSGVPDVPGGTLLPMSAVVLPLISGVGGSVQHTAADVLRIVSGLDLTWVWLGGAVLLPLFTWRALDRYSSRRRTASIVMEHFAHRFLSEFERPLIQRPAERPVRSQLRLSPGRSRLEILLAPGHGRRYPNLSDHKKNMEYDVARIVRLLADDSFVRGPLYSRAEWVVVPFRFKMRGKRTGVTCISSF